MQIVGLELSAEVSIALRATALLVLLMLLLLAQRLRPLRGDANWSRWRNLALGALAGFCTYLLVPLGAIGAAELAARQQIGLLNIWKLPLYAELIVCIVVFDFAIYWQHRASHQIPWLWRLHRVHHSDTGFDVTLGLRFHPAEIMLSMLYKMLIVTLLGAHPAVVASSELLLAACALITHVDIAWPKAWESWMRGWIVTSDWHRIHHSPESVETNSNYGNFLIVWDRCFASAREQPKTPHQQMAIGLAEFHEAADQTVLALLKQPLRAAPKG